MFPTAVAAGISYFALVFLLGFALGVLRNWFIAPLVGETVAIAIELPVMLASSWVICGWLIRRQRVSMRMAQRLAMGATAFALLMTGEFAISSLLLERTLAEHFATYRLTPQLLGLIGQTAFGVFPAMRWK